VKVITEPANESLHTPYLALIGAESACGRVDSMNKLILTTTSLLAGAALVLGGVVAADAATTSPTLSATSSATNCSFGQHLLSAFRGGSKDLRADLTKARTEAKGPTRRANIAAIKTKALDGGYGANVEAKAKFLQSHPGDLKGVRPLPANLKADLSTLHAAKGKTAKLAELNTIADKALAGGYGANIETLAKDVQSSGAWQNCTPAGSGS
jgi:hypothetical protein